MLVINPSSTYTEVQNQQEYYNVLAWLRTRNEPVDEVSHLILIDKAVKFIAKDTNGDGFWKAMTAKEITSRKGYSYHPYKDIKAELDSFKAQSDILKVFPESGYVESMRADLVKLVQNMRYRLPDAVPASSKHIGIAWNENGHWFVSQGSTQVPYTLQQFSLLLTPGFTDISGSLSYTPGIGKTGTPNKDFGEIKVKIIKRDLPVKEINELKINTPKIIL